MNYYELKRIDTLARRNFTYVVDPQNEDHWRSFAESVLKNEAWSGDCDDLASTVLDLLSRYEMPSDKLFRAVVSMEKNDTADHMVGIAELEDGRLWIVGDTFGKPYEISKMEHRLLKVSRLSEGVNWRNAEID